MNTNDISILVDELSSKSQAERLRTDGLTAVLRRFRTGGGNVFDMMRALAQLVAAGTIAPAETSQ